MTCSLHDSRAGGPLWLVVVSADRALPGLAIISVEKSLLPGLYYFLCLSLSPPSFLFDLILLIYPLGQSVALLVGVTTISTSMCIPRSSFLSPSLDFPTLHLLPFSPFLSNICISYSLKHHFVKSCFHLSKMAVKLKLFYCVRSKENINKNPF